MDSLSVKNSPSQTVKTIRKLVSAKEERRFPGLEKMAILVQKLLDQVKNDENEASLEQRSEATETHLRLLRRRWRKKGENLTHPPSIYDSS